MHLEVLVEDASGRTALGHLIPKILGPHGQPHTWRILPYKGVGKLPPNLNKQPDARKRILLENLPRLLRGYGKAYQRAPGVAVVVVVDSDRKNCKTFKRELMGLLATCAPAPRILFRIAIEEMEAWLLGDREAVHAAYPRARMGVLAKYVQDSVCDTWELLAEAVYPGGARKLREVGYPITGQAKCEWADRIAPHIDIHRNASTSFRTFCEGIVRLART